MPKKNSLDFIELDYLSIPQMAQELGISDDFAKTVINRMYMEKHNFKFHDQTIRTVHSKGGVYYIHPCAADEIREFIDKTWPFKEADYLNAEQIAKALGYSVEFTQKTLAAMDNGDTVFVLDGQAMRIVRRYKKTRLVHRDSLGFFKEYADRQIEKSNRPAFIKSDIKTLSQTAKQFGIPLDAAKKAAKILALKKAIVPNKKTQTPVVFTRDNVTKIHPLGQQIFLEQVREIMAKGK